MRCFLVMARCCVDDIPLGVFDTLEHAKRAASAMRQTDVESLAKAAGFPGDAKPIEDGPIHIVEFHDGRAVGHSQFGYFSEGQVASIEGEALRVTPAVRRILESIDSDASVQSLLLAVADAVQDSSAEVGEDSSAAADDIRRVVVKWQRKAAVN